MDDDARCFRTSKPKRAPGQPPCRCLWCLKFRCQELMSLCAECQGEYNHRAMGMPKDERITLPAGRPQRKGASVNAG